MIDLSFSVLSFFHNNTDHEMCEEYYALFLIVVKL